MKGKSLFKLLSAICLAAVIAIPLAVSCAAPEPVPGPAGPPGPAGEPGAPGAPAPAPAPEKVIKIKFSSTYPPLHPVYYDSETLLMERIEKLSNDRVEITSYPIGGLLKGHEVWDGVNAGMADLGDVFPHIYPGQFRIAEMFMLPFLGSSSAIVSPAANDLVREFPGVFLPQFAGTRVMTTHVTAVCNLHTTKKQVRTLEDLKGMLIAGENPIQLDAIKSWGAVPVHITMAEGYLALEKGIIEGGIWPWAPLKSFKLADLLNYHTIIDFNFSVNFPIFNQEKWDSLPPDIQGIFDEVLGINWAALTGYTLDNGSAVDVQWMKDKGDGFYTLPPDERARWVELSSGAFEKWKADVSKLGVDGDVLWTRMQELMTQYEADPYPEQDWFGYAGRDGSPRRPGG